MIIYNNVFTGIVEKVWKDNESYRVQDNMLNVSPFDLNVVQKNYYFVPLENPDMSDLDFNTSVEELDKQLYKKYKLTDNEINAIENGVKYLRK